MSREEAIADIRDNIKPVVGGKSLDMAIEALEQEPCTDAISRQAAINVAIDAVDDWDGGCNLSREEYIRKALERLRPVTPQYTDAEIQKMQDFEFAEIQKAYEIGKAENIDVLDKIRAEIEAKCCITVGRENDGAITLHDVFEIIDKYKAESEERNEQNE